MRHVPLLRRFAVVLVVVGYGLLVGGGVTSAAPSQQPPPSGTITFTAVDVKGTQSTIFHGVTSGPCDDPSSNAYNAVVAGPGVFTPNEATGNPDGLTFAGTQDFGFSKTQPNMFDQRISFADLAQEAGGPLMAGTYTVTFRCVDGFILTIFKTYQSTLTVSAPDAIGVQTITPNNPTGPTPTPGGPTPTPAGPTPTPATNPTPTPTGTATPTPSTSPTPTPSPLSSPTPTASPTPMPDTSPTPTPSSSSPPSPSPTTFPTGDNGSGGSGTGTGTSGGGALAFTGVPLDIIVPAGLVLCALGAGLLIAQHRRAQG